MSSSNAILEFWFGGEEPQRFRPEWFNGGEAFDQEIARRFQMEIGQALSSGLDGWDGMPRSALALVLLLDQFPRNAYRGTPLAFAGDIRAQEVTLMGLERGYQQRFTPLERLFFYLPLEHAENLALQDRSVELMRQLEAEAPELAKAQLADYAERHRDVIARFGRFPHRNEILGRDSTPEEFQFLAEPGSSF
ncbi:membrane protein [Elstera litoralis]|uniref:Membrane protein n=1 Tax=Elstera litoralis TaxID=552518 RepID=A0A0F3IWP6_9PROT|nr:DUF924 family protein [Elstera litoralis]KJV10039.1 membrane protein [Elstera litoralis]